MCLGVMAIIRTFGGRSPCASVVVRGVGLGIGMAKALGPEATARACCGGTGTGAARARVVVMDVPLLYETGGKDACHAVVVVSAPKCVQRSRALRRPGMSEKKLEDILDKQTPDHLKRNHADFVVLAGLGKRPALTKVSSVLRTVH